MFVRNSCDAPPPNMWSREGFRFASEGWRVIQNNTLFPVYAAFNAGFHPDLSSQSRCERKDTCVNTPLEGKKVCVGQRKSGTL